MPENVAGQPAGGSILKIKAEALCKIIMRHSELYERSNVDLADVAPLELEIAELTSAYSNAAEERTGVAVVFRQQSLPEYGMTEGPIPGDEREDGSTAARHEALPEEEEEEEEIFLVDKWYVGVNSSAAITEFARQRAGTDISSPEEAARLLCEKDGWKPEQYPGGLISVLDHEVQLCEY